MGFQDSTGKAWMVFSTTGAPVSTQAMSIAAKQAAQGKPIPSGLAVEPATIDSQGNYSPSTQGGMMRDTLNSMQAKAQELGAPLDSPTPWGGPVVQKLWQLIKQAPGAVAQTVGTPENIGGLVGGVVGGLAGGPEGALLGTLTRVGLTGGGVALGRLAGGAMAGAPPDLPTAAVQGAMAGATGGALELTNFFMNQYLTAPWVRNKLATDLVQMAQEEHPGLATDPRLFNAYGASGAKQWQGIAQKMGQALQTDAEVSTHELTANLMNDIQQNAQAVYAGKVPEDLLTQATQKALVSNSQAAMGAYKNYLNDVANGKDVKPLIELFLPYSKKASDLIAKDTAGFLDEPGVNSVVQQTFTDYAKSQEHTVAGAQFLDLLRQSGQKGGFDPQTLWQLVKTKYLQDPDSLTGRMGQLLENNPMAQPMTPGAGLGSKYLPQWAQQVQPNVLSGNMPSNMPLAGRIVSQGIGPAEGAVSAASGPVSESALKTFSGNEPER